MNKIQNEEPISIRLLRDGKVLKRNVFDTERGQYFVYNILYDGCIYFVKMLSGKIVEAVNLTKLGGKHEKKSKRSNI